jgi:hypothetical protein
MQLTDFITIESVTTLGVAAVGVTAVTNTLRKVFHCPPIQTAFGASLLISFLIIAAAKDREWYHWILGFVNACVLFCTAMGINDGGAIAQRQSVKAKASAAKGRGFGPEFGPEAEHREVIAAKPKWFRSWLEPN